MQFKLQITIDVHQDVTWPNQAAGYQFEVTIDGLGKPVTIQGSINRHGILTPTAANDSLIKDVLAIIEEVIK